MKKELVGYVTGMVNNHNLTLGMVGNTLDHNLNLMQKKMIGNLDDLLEYIIDMPEESTDVTDLQNKYGGLEIAYKELKEEKEKLQRYYDTSLSTIDIFMDKKEKEAVSISLGTTTELQELKCKLAEAEETITNFNNNEEKSNARVEKAELESKAYSTTTYELVQTNDRLKQLSDNSRNQVKQLKSQVEQLRFDNKQLKAERYQVGLNK